MTKTNWLFLLAVFAIGSLGFAAGAQSGYQSGVKTRQIVISNNSSTAYPQLDVPLSVTVGYPSGNSRYFPMPTSDNLHDYLIRSVLDNAMSANLTWNYTAFKEYGVLTVNWER